jgi:hypothetical protein
LEIVGKWLLTGGKDLDMPKFRMHVRGKSLGDVKNTLREVLVVVLSAGQL